MGKIDQYAKAVRNKRTNTCLLHAKERAVIWLGSTARHECDQTCIHRETCEKCIFALDLSEPVSSPLACLLEDYRGLNMSKADAHKKAIEVARN